jgi:hypothetical protein
MASTPEALAASSLLITNERPGKLGMTLASLRHESGEQITLRLEARVAFEPSVYKGTGEEPRKNIVLRLSHQDAKDVEAFQEKVQQLACVGADKWNSCIQGETLKCKINVLGPRRCAFMDAKTKKYGDPPESFKDRPVSAVISVQGVYSQNKGAGLLLDVVALKYGEAEQIDWFKDD